MTPLDLVRELDKIIDKPLIIGLAIGAESMLQRKR